MTAFKRRRLMVYVVTVIAPMPIMAVLFVLDLPIAILVIGLAAAETAALRYNYVALRRLDQDEHRAVPGR